MAQFTKSKRVEKREVKWSLEKSSSIWAFSKATILAFPSKDQMAPYVGSTRRKLSKLRRSASIIEPASSLPSRKGFILKFSLRISPLTHCFNLSSRGWNVWGASEIGATNWKLMPSGWVALQKGVFIVPKPCSIKGLCHPHKYFYGCSSHLTSGESFNYGLFHPI